MKNLTALGVGILLALGLVGCSATPAGPTFEERCADRDGTVMSDTTTKLLTGVVTGTVVSPNGSAGMGTGVATSPVTITMRLCVVDGDIEEMEVL